LHACQVFDKADGTADVPAEVSDEEGRGNAPAGGNGAGGEGNGAHEGGGNAGGENGGDGAGGEGGNGAGGEEMEEMEMEEMEVNLIQKEKMKTRKRMRKSRRKEIQICQRRQQEKAPPQRKTVSGRDTAGMTSYRSVIKKRSEKTLLRAPGPMPSGRL